MVDNSTIILSLQKKTNMEDWYSLTDLEILSEMGKRFRTLRISKNLTQEELALKSGLNRSTIRDLENGKPLNALSLLQVIRCLEILQKLDDFLPGVKNSPVIAVLQENRQRVRLSGKNKTSPIQ